MKLIYVYGFLLTFATTIMGLSYADPVVRISTNYGDIDVKMRPDKAPGTVSNFLAYVQDGSYKNSIFHRVIQGFMIQGGGFDEKLNRLETKGGIRNESIGGLSNARYTVAMARTNDPHSASRQFFINVENNVFLNAKNGRHGYAVFGEVVLGKGVVDQISIVPTGREKRYGFKDVPMKPVIIKSVEVIKIKTDNVIPSTP